MKHLCYIVLGLSFVACRENAPLQNWYYWKTTLHLDSIERSYAQKLNSKVLYLRFFDVDYHPRQGAVPIGDLQVTNANIQPFEQVVAVVFITNRAMLHTQMPELEKLAEKIALKIIRKSQRYHLPLQGIQLDCDWSQQTKDKFFTLCKIVHQFCRERQMRFSVTIRLHQYKYFEQTGVPDADEGVLMLYNVGDIEGRNTENSILDLALVEKYLQDTETYPLPLKVALPLFEWAVVKRMGKVVHLLSEITENELQGNIFLKKIRKNFYLVEENHYFGKVFLYKGDELRWESVTINQLKQLLSMVASKVVYSEMLFYHLDGRLISKKYSYETLQSLVRTWF